MEATSPFKAFPQNCCETPAKAPDCNGPCSAQHFSFCTSKVRPRRAHCTFCSEVLLCAVDWQEHCEQAGLAGATPVVLAFCSWLLRKWDALFAYGQEDFSSARLPGDRLTSMTGCRDSTLAVQLEVGRRASGQALVSDCMMVTLPVFPFWHTWLLNTDSFPHTKPQ